MYKIAYVPLDERPCNYAFPNLLVPHTEVTLVEPSLDLMGDKKTPGKTSEIWKWLFKTIEHCDGAILSIDTLIYGGIIPSRLHHLSLEECKEALQQLDQLKELNPNVKLYAFSLIMRCPKYSSSDEEPDYYEEYGQEIFNYGRLQHLISANLASNEEKEEFARLETFVPKTIMNDFLTRRAINVEVNKLVLEYVKKGIIDFLVIPQDDSAPYGWTALDQQKVRQTIAQLDLEMDVYMYPGADEVGLTLLARMLNHFKNERPRIYPYFSSVEGPSVTPLYEDRPLLESVKYQILAAGGLLTYQLNDADLVLLLNSPVDSMMEAAYQDELSTKYQVNRNIIELVEQAEHIMKQYNIPVIVGDVAFANGSDLTLLKLLKHKNLLFKLAGYAGWNTSSNSLGTCIAQGIIYRLFGKTSEHLDFLALRYVEDAGYCSAVRKHVTNEILPEYGYNYFAIDGQRGVIAEIVRTELDQFIKTNIETEDNRIEIIDLYMPWRRMFEVGLKVKYRNLKKYESIDYKELQP